MAQPTVIIEFIQKSKENGAPGMQPNLYKFFYYQWLIEVAFGKSGPESGPQTQIEAFWSRLRIWDLRCNSNTLGFYNLNLSSFNKQIFYAPRREWKPYIQHNSKLDNLWTGFEIAER